MPFLWNIKAKVYACFRAFFPFNLILNSEKKHIQSLSQYLFKPVQLSLDIGSGVGDTLDVLPESGHQVVVDHSCSMLRKTKSCHPNVNPVCADANQLPFKNNTFDFISSIGLIEYISDPEFLLKYLSNLLTNDGYLLLTMAPNHLFNQLRHIHGHKLYLSSTKQWEDLLFDTGYQIIGMRKGFLQWVYLVRKRDSL